MEKIIRELYDDMSETEEKADGTVEFGLDGVDYAIDLNNKRATRLRDFVQEYIAHARVVNHRKAAKATVTQTFRTDLGSGYDKTQLPTIRNWARKNGWPNLSDKGRVPKDALTAFEDAGGLSRLEPEFSA